VNQPIAVFQTARHPGHVTILTDKPSPQGTILVAVEAVKAGKGVSILDVLTIYGKNSIGILNRFTDFSKEIKPNFVDLEKATAWLDAHSGSYSWREPTKPLESLDSISKVVQQILVDNG
jgi:hypothetical protein